MILSSIVALSENNAIGRGGKLPWHLPADLARFKKITMGHAIVMGRKTYESIGRPLPGRRTTIISRNPSYSASGASVVRSFEEALETLASEDEVFIIGGEAIFRLALPLSHRLYVTRVHADVEGDVFFPRDAFDGWKLLSEELHPADDRHRHAFTFQVYARA